VTNVVWAGPPVVSDKNRNLSYRQVNQSLADTSLLIPELKYLDAFTNLQPDLSATINGNRILLRQADGIHWTREASAVIATELKAMLAALRP
jgi:lysophospholipase L1-like esterase